MAKIACRRQAPRRWRTVGRNALLVDFGGTLDADGDPWVDRFFRMYVLSPAGWSTGICSGSPLPSRMSSAGKAGPAGWRGDELLRHRGGAGEAAGGDAAGWWLAWIPPPLRHGFVAEATAIARRNRSILVGSWQAVRVGGGVELSGEPPALLWTRAGSGGDLFDVVSDFRKWSGAAEARPPWILNVTLAGLGSAAVNCWMGQRYVRPSRHRAGNGARNADLLAGADGAIMVGITPTSADRSASTSCPWPSSRSDARSGAGGWRGFAARRVGASRRRRRWWRSAGGRRWCGWSPRVVGVGCGNGDLRGA